MAGKRAFTIVELLVVVGIIVILTALVVPAVTGARTAANRAKATAQMRMIGLGILAYTSDQNGYLPGPLSAGQGAAFDPTAPAQLATRLGPYVGVTNFGMKTVISAFLPVSYVTAMPGQDPYSARPYVMNISAQVNGRGFSPWGSTVAPQAPPMKLIAVPVRTWAFCDADQLNPLVKDQPWSGQTPRKMVNGPGRLALYLDGSAGPIAESDIIAPNSDGGGPPPPPPPPPPPLPH